MSFKSIIPYKYRLVYGFCQLIEHFFGKQNGMYITKKIRKKLYKKVIKFLKSKPQNVIIPVKRIPANSSNSIIKKLISKRVPFIIDNGAKDWVSVKKWDFDYLNSKYGNDEIVIHDFETPENPHIKTTLKEILSKLENSNAPYFRFYPFLQKHPERVKDINMSWIYQFVNENSLFKHIQLFIGPKNSYTPIHNAYANNFFVQIKGIKNWVLYHWKDTLIIDPNPVYSNYRVAPKRNNKDSFNPFENDYEPPFELYRYIPKYTLSLKPGDIFYNPPYVWHAVKNEGKNIGFGFRWVSLSHSFMTSPLYFMLDVFTKNPTFFKTMKEAKKDFNKFNIKHIKKESV